MSGFDTIYLQRFAPTQGIFSDAKCEDNNVFLFRPVENNDTDFITKYGVLCWQNAYTYMQTNYNYLHTEVLVDGKEIKSISGTSEDFECHLMPDVKTYAVPGEESAVIAYLNTRGIVNTDDAGIFCRYGGYYPNLIKLNFVDAGQDPALGFNSAASALGLVTTLMTSPFLMFTMALAINYANDLIFGKLSSWLANYKVR